MDFNHFLKERRGRWQRLSYLLDQVEDKGIESLGRHDADEFFALYRLVSSDLSLVQTRAGHLDLVEYLEGLVARAHAQLTVPRRATFFRSWWMILRHYFPAAVRANWTVVALSAGAMLAGVLLGLIATFINPQAADHFVGAEHLYESPSERVARLEEAERQGSSQINTAGEHGRFTTFLFNNNIRVSVLAFALGMTFGIGTAIVMFYNGALIGSVAALYIMDGESVFLAAWIGPHGSIELPCAMLAGAAGLLLARCMFRRSRGSFTTQVRAIRQPLVDIMVGVATFLVLAGIIEGGFSQVNEPTLPYWLKIVVATLLLIAFMGYLFVMPVKQRPRDDDDVVTEAAVSGSPFSWRDLFSRRPRAASVTG